MVVFLNVEPPKFDSCPHKQDFGRKQLTHNNPETGRRWTSSCPNSLKFPRRVRVLDSLLEAQGGTKPGSLVLPSRLELLSHPPPLQLHSRSAPSSSSVEAHIGRVCRVWLLLLPPHHRAVVPWKQLDTAPGMCIRWVSVRVERLRWEKAGGRAVAQCAWAVSHRGGRRAEPWDLRSTGDETVRCGVGSGV